MDRLFDARFQSVDNVRRERHGAIWEQDELQGLKGLFLEGTSLQDMCETLQRPAKGVLPKLVELGCLRYDNINHRYYYSARAEKYFDNSKREHRAERKAMNINGPIVIENQTNINGQDISKFSDSELYGLIAEQELKIKELEAIQHKPKRLIAEIERRTAGIEALVKYLDSKEA